MAIQNLVHYSVIMIHEYYTACTCDHSNHKWEKGGYLEDLFEEYIPDDVKIGEDVERSNNDISMNVSEREGVSTASVLDDFKKDMGSMQYLRSTCGMITQ